MASQTHLPWEMGSPHTKQSPQSGVGTEECIWSFVDPDPFDWYIFLAGQTNSLFLQTNVNKVYIFKNPFQLIRGKTWITHHLCHLYHLDKPGKEKTTNHAEVCHLFWGDLECVPLLLGRSLEVSSQCLESCPCLWLASECDLGTSEYFQAWCSQQVEGPVPTQQYK